jgi:lactate racemase
MNLKYGDRTVHLKFRPEQLLGFIRPNVVLPKEEPNEIIHAALDTCDNTLKTFKSGDKVVVVTSDITRYTGSEIYLPMLVERLAARGITYADIEIIIALGIHRKQTESEHKKILGVLFDKITVSDHECDDPGELINLGSTSNGIVVEINRKVAEADKVILTGTIGFHYFAGFGGGRKAVLPGVASRRSCMASHFAVLNPGEGAGKNSAATTGKLKGNPVHQAMVEACAKVKPAFMLNTVLTPEKQIIAAFAGNWQEAHLRGCDFYARHFTFPIKKKADLVIVSCGGFPKDINFIQSHKAMEYGSQALKDGGVMILLAQCKDGYGNSSFFSWFRYEELEKFESALRTHYEINGQTAYSTFLKAKRFKVILVSDLPFHDVETMGMIPADTLDMALELAKHLLPAAYSAYIIPEGGNVLPVYTPDNEYVH